MIRNVLVIAYYFPPMGLSGVQRTSKFVKYLPEYGWKPHVLTCDSQAYYAFDETLEAEIASERIAVYRTPPDISRFAKPKDGKTMKYPSKFASKLKKMAIQTVCQPDSRISWKKAALALGSEIIENNDIHAIYATAPPFTDFLVAQELSDKYGISFIVDYRDLWVDNAYYFYASPFHKSYAMDLERQTLNRAKRAIVINRFMKEKLIQRYKFLSHDDVTIIPHGFDEADFEPHKRVKPDSNKFTITHSGLFPDDLTPKYFLKGLSLFLSKNPQVREKFLARFVGLLRKSDLKLIKKYKLTDVVTTDGYLPHDETVKALMESDALWMMIPNIIATPSRLYEYLGSRKPMLVCAPEGNIRQTAMESNAAFTTNPKDVKAIAEALENMFNLWKSGALPRAKEEYVEQFDRYKLTGLLARELALSAHV